MNAILIASQIAFDKYFPDLCSEPLLAVDTEFFRETTYFPQLGLVQVANASIVACIDPIAFDARASLAALLLSPEITKVFHSCSQDLEVLGLYLGELPCPVLDTQIAVSMLDETEQISYAKLVFNELGVELDKSQTRTNWLKRPLSAKQLKYAAEDVYYLYQLIERLCKKLDALKRRHWFAEDCNNLCSSPQPFSPDITNCGLRVKGTHKLSGLELAIINAIANWREQIAISRDSNRRRVMTDDDMVLIATSKPDSLEALTQTGQLTRYFRGNELESLFEIATQSYRIPEAEWPLRINNRPSPEEKEQLESLQSLVDTKASALKISSSVLCPRKELSQLFYGNRDSRVLTGWRLDVVGNELLNFLNLRIIDDANAPI